MQMAGIAGADVLNDRLRFRNFFRTLPSFEIVGPSLAVLAREFIWTKMAIISQEESLFVLVFKTVFIMVHFMPTTVTVLLTGSRNVECYIQVRGTNSRHVCHH